MLASASSIPNPARQRDLKRIALLHFGLLLNHVAFCFSFHNCKMMRGSLHLQPQRMPNLISAHLAPQEPGRLHQRSCQAHKAVFCPSCTPRNHVKASKRGWRAVSRAEPAQAMDFQGPDALLFDCDGVLVDTEAEGHRIAFSKAFKEKGELLLFCKFLPHSLHAHRTAKRLI